MNKIKKTILTLALLLTAVGGAWAQTQWESGSCTVTLNNGIMTVSGNGTMADYMYNSDRPWDNNRNDITSVVVESGVTSVGFHAFEGFSNLTSVTLPEGLTAIGEMAFYSCSSLQSITIPSTVTSIGAGAFWSCSAITSITLPEGLKAIGDMTFGDCGSLTSITLPEGLTAIESMAFSSCSSLTSITIPSTVTSIGDYAFMSSSAISDINLYANPGNLTWGDTSMDFMSGNATKCHVLAEHLSTYQNKFGSANVTFVGDLQPLASGPEVAWDKAKKSGSFTMPGGNVTLEPEYYPQAALAAAPTAINDVPATTDGAIVEAGTVANIGETTTAQGTVMYYVSKDALDDAALLALAADQWTADVPTAAHLAQGQAYVYYYVRGNDGDTDEENFSDGDILAANALTVTLGAAPLWNAEFDLTDAPEEDKAGKWSTDIPEGGVVKGQTVTVTYTGAKKVIGVKAEKKAKPAETTVTLTPGEIGDLFSWGSTSKTINGITIAISGDARFHGFGLMKVNAEDPDTGEPVPTTGTYTFTSSVGKIKRIDINHNVGNWREPGAGWPGSYGVADISTFTWSGTPAASVTLNASSNDENDCELNDISSFVFTIEPTN